ncbi:hypothetical protein [Vallitalea maricola]|uniref:Uncharacterized protein n=1 Tax=Vallitalea maricola TaxID=3074433 RepID=A0ACB5UNY7_9FIRM|nr:hypothetical protein AN2V17_39140 [Vallitalea sp. AN17-2]
MGNGNKKIIMMNLYYENSRAEGHVKIIFGKSSLIFPIDSILELLVLKEKNIWNMGSKVKKNKIYIA